MSLVTAAGGSSPCLSLEIPHKGIQGPLRAVSFQGSNFETSTDALDASRQTQQQPQTGARHWISPRKQQPPEAAPNSMRRPPSNDELGFERRRNLMLGGCASSYIRLCT
eukprot:CAMPEP_0115502364 /NCGR_PEP_ID=MMETSP0271-20121206/68904_1 /TAXON_ID=71861 /ORGANISM="Scrippsiella trochoidea, Strain CCMP3099" /LENGTH=108 /DNA_ID=CAMNT_0002931385 /DNA_START=115 /DNA_END=438 /DNA_ORIENTATION=+